MDLTQWPTLDEAAAALRTSPRTLRRENDRGNLEIRKRERPHKKPVNVVNPDDLAKLIEKETPKPFPVQMPAAPPQFHPEAFAFTVPALQPSQVDRFIEALQNMTAQRQLPAPEPPPPAPAGPPAVPVHIKLWLTVEEAAAYSGYRETELRQAIAAGSLHANRGGRRRSWIILRESLERFNK